MNFNKTGLILTATLFGLAGCDDSPPPAADEVEVAHWQAPPPPSASLFEGLPWTLDGIKEIYQEGATLIYARSGIDKDGATVSGTHTFEVKEITPQVINIDSIFDDGMRKGTGSNTYDWDRAVFLESFPGSDSTEFSVTGNETVTVPAGMFETTVVEVTNSFFKTRETYWLIDDQPGVYAKWVDYGKQDSPANVVMELIEVRLPTP